MNEAWKQQRAALVIAHPGHELRVHHWLEQARPLTFVLTDGSGGAAEGRIESTARLLDRAGARRAALFGRFTDRELYRRVMAAEFGVFTALVDEIAAGLLADKIDYVAGDAVEGYNPSHDVCRLVIGAAVRRVQAQTGRELPTVDFLLVGRPDDCPPDRRTGAIHLILDEAAMQRKLAAADDYPELKAEVARAIALAGVEAFRHEWLRPVGADEGYAGFSGSVPFYESYGEKMVAAGRYTEVLRWEQHLRPLADALRRHAEAP